jgi:hypothetical protein
VKEEFKHLKGTIDIYSLEDMVKSEVTIHVEIKYKVPSLPKPKGDNKS